MVRAENDGGKWGGGEHEVWGMEAVKRKRRIVEERVGRRKEKVLAGGEMRCEREEQKKGKSQSVSGWVTGAFGVGGEGRGGEDNERQRENWVWVGEWW